MGIERWLSLRRDRGDLKTPYPAISKSQVYALARDNVGGPRPEERETSIEFFDPGHPSYGRPGRWFTLLITLSPDIHLACGRKSGRYILFERKRGVEISSN